MPRDEAELAGVLERFSVLRVKKTGHRLAVTGHGRQLRIRSLIARRQPRLWYVGGDLDFGLKSSDQAVQELRDS